MFICRLGILYGRILGESASLDMFLLYDVLGSSAVHIKELQYLQLLTGDVFWNWAAAPDHFPHNSWQMRGKLISFRFGKLQAGGSGYHRKAEAEQRGDRSIVKKAVNGGGEKRMGISVEDRKNAA